MTGNPLAGKDHARGAFLALAGGARFGAPFAFIRDASVQTRPVTLGNWTEDTHRSFYPPMAMGGRRSGSALGLAVAAALRWRVDLGLAVEKSARIPGDPDAVACLTSALLGAAGGTAAIPSPWLATLPQRQTLAVLADQLWVQGRLVYTGQCP